MQRILTALSRWAGILPAGIFHWEERPLRAHCSEDRAQIPVPRQVLIVCRILDRGRSMPLSAALEVPFARAHTIPALLQDEQNARSLQGLGAFSSTAASGRRKSGMLWETQVSRSLSRAKSQAARKLQKYGCRKCSFDALTLACSIPTLQIIGRVHMGVKDLTC